MSEYSIALSSIVKDLGLSVLHASRDFDTARISTADVNRPALQLAGFYDYFDPKRLQLIGRVETRYLEQLAPEERRRALERFMRFDISALITCHGVDLLPELVELSERYDRTLLTTQEDTSTFMADLISLLRSALAPRLTMHGVLVEVSGEGLLITGDSGVGKSETALELIKRGHRLIADDAVEIKKVSPHELVGSAPPVLKHYIELRGIGVINVAKLFGMGAVKESSNIDLIINMVPWRDGEAYDRLGMETQYTEILDVKVPSITVPITPGRNLAVIFEVAAMNNRQKRMGYNAAVEFTEQMSKYFTSRNDD